MQSLLAIKITALTELSYSKYLNGQNVQEREKVNANWTSRHFVFSY